MIIRCRITKSVNNELLGCATAWSGLIYLSEKKLIRPRIISDTKQGFPRHEAEVPDYPAVTF